MQRPGTATIVVLVTATLAVGQPEKQEVPPANPNAIASKTIEILQPPPPRWPVVVTPLAERAEFRPGVIERGEADEPDIGLMEADAPDGVEVGATVERADLQQLQPVRLTAVVKNSSQLQWRIGSEGTNPYLAARVRVFDMSGKLLPPTRFYQGDGRQMNELGGGMNLFGATLQPGDSLRYDLIPNLLYDMTLPGEYWVLVEFKIHSPQLIKELQGSGRARARPIKVRVKPDPTKFGAPFKPRITPP